MQKKRADINRKAETFKPALKSVDDGKVLTGTPTVKESSKEAVKTAPKIALLKHSAIPNQSYATAGKVLQKSPPVTEVSKVSKPKKEMKRHKKGQAPEREKEAETEENYQTEQPEGPTVVKTVFELPKSEVKHCANFEQPVVAMSKDNSSSSKRTALPQSKSAHPLELRDQNYVELQKIKLSGKKLGEGGFSVVHEGIWLGTNVAVKVINITNKKDELKAIEQIKRMIKLRHPRVIELYKYSVDETNSGTHIYMVMQRMETDLSNHTFKSFGDKLRVIKQIVEGLRMLHEQSIVHRDLKPQNILVDSKGDIRLADLGISALLDSDQPKSMTVAFTLKYAPPEVCIESITDLKNDIWSLGLVIYEILTGTGPWDKRKKQEIMKGLFQRQSPLDQDWQHRVEIVAGDKQVATVLTGLIGDCLKIEMTDRPSIGEVQERLSAVTNSTS